MPKEQVFISHVYEERHVALVLEKYIKQAFDGLGYLPRLTRKALAAGRSGSHTSPIT
jgi:hypothetical protein